MSVSNRQFVQRTVVAVAVCIMVACAWLAPLDTAATEQIDAGLKRALISFATARALNAVISVAQGTEVAVEPAGVGVVFTPGQILDPVNDLVEQFSDLMLAASVAFGIQKLLISIGAYWGVSLLLSITALAWAFRYIRQRPSIDWLSRMLVLLLMVRFTVPVMSIGSEVMFKKFMETDYATSQQAIDSASTDLEKLNPPVAVKTEPAGMIESIKDWWSQDSRVGTRFEHLKMLAEQSTENIIRLMAIFVLQTLVIPLLILWVMYGVVRRTFELR